MTNLRLQLRHSLFVVVTKTFVLIVDVVDLVAVMQARTECG